MIVQPFKVKRMLGFLYASSYYYCKMYKNEV